jgi:hypothetical protein
MAYNKMVYRINSLREKVFCDVDKTPKTDHVIELICDRCGEKWNANTSNWFVRKKRKSYIGELCGSCTRSGERNPAYGQNPHKNMSVEEIQLLKKNLSKTLSGKNNPMYGKHHSPTTRALQSKSKVDLLTEGKFNIKSCNRGRKAFYVSTKSGIQFYADSILELARMIELDNDTSVIEWTKHHGIRIPYVFNGIDYNYVPDFLIKNEKGSIIEEVKGRMIPGDVEKQQQAIVYCQQNGYEYRMVTGNDLQDLSNYKKLLKETKKC